MLRKFCDILQSKTIRIELAIVCTVLIVTALFFWVSGFRIEIVKDWAQVAFWTVASTIACLTYINARRGILQPLRTEVFKSQLEALKPVQSIFSLKSELELRSDVGLHDMVNRNAQRLFADFSKVYFSRKYTTTPMGVGDGWRPMNSTMQLRLEDKRWLVPEAFSAADRRDFWNAYQVYGLEIPKSRSEGIERIRQAIEHPLMPKTVVEAMQSYLRAIMKPNDLLPKVLLRCAQQLPEKFTTFESIDQYVDGNNGVSWVWNTFNMELVETEGQTFSKNFADGVSQSIRKYLVVDKLQDP